MKIEDLRKIRVELMKAKFGQSKLDIEPNPCYSGYEPIGLKDDGSPNCVPIKEEQSKEKFVISSPNSNEDEQSYISRCISDIGSEYDQEGQAYAVCKGKWDE